MVRQGRLFVVKTIGVGGQVHMIIGPTDFQDAWDTVYAKDTVQYGIYMRDKLLCADDMSGPSALATQRIP